MPHLLLAPRPPAPLYNDTRPQTVRPTGKRGKGNYYSTALCTKQKGNRSSKLRREQCVLYLCRLSQLRLEGVAEKFRHVGVGGRQGDLYGRHHLHLHRTMFPSNLHPLRIARRAEAGVDEADGAAAFASAGATVFEEPATAALRPADAVHARFCRRALSSIEEVFFGVLAARQRWCSWLSTLLLVNLVVLAVC